MRRNGVEQLVTDWYKYSDGVELLCNGVEQLVTDWYKYSDGVELLCNGVELLYDGVEWE